MLFSLTTNTKIKIIINSWVSFKNLDGYSKNYNMFPRLLTLANQYNIIATEWDFVDELFFAKIISKYKFDDIDFCGIKINYAFNEHLTHIPKNVFFRCVKTNRVIYFIFIWKKCIIYFVS